MTSRLAIPLLAAAGVLALGACSDNGGYDATRKSAPVAQAQLPPLEPAQTGYSEDKALAYDGYALAERAHSFDTSVQSRRPDYAFRYEDEEPLVWRTADDYSMYAEPYDGGYRNYYYAPGADHPYFVRDRSYGYGYGPDGRVRAVYDSRGALVSGDSLARLAMVAADVYLRARTVRRYGEDERYRVVVEQPYWAERSRTYYAAQSTWIAAPERQPQWREWRRSHPREVVTYVAPAPRHDNGKHLGWAKQDRKAEAPPKVDVRREDRFARAYAPAVVGVPAAVVVRLREDDGPGRGPDYGKVGGKGHDKAEKHDGGNGKGHGPDKGKDHGDKGNGHGKGHDKD